MGYGCPDDPTKPGWCDPRFGGLSNQLYRAAWQFQRYANPPGTSNFFTWFPVAATTAVRYHPNADCGSSAVRIQNKATAALYYYTPYQPNASALATMNGLGDSCSAYGNRNFWRFFRDWFGSPTGAEEPSATEASAVYRFWSDTFQGHFYTRSVNERNKVIDLYPDSVWRYEGARFGAFGRQVEGTTPVYRFWSDALKAHFYTPSARERDRVIANYPDHIWKYERIAFYAYSASSSVEGTVPVHRFWSPTFQNHFYTSSTPEANRVRANYPPSIWTYEGTTFRVDAKVPMEAVLP